MQGIGGHDLALDVDVFEQGAQFRDFVGFPGDFFLCDGRPLAMHESAEEMDLGPVFPDRAFEHFAIDGHRLKSGDAQQPGTDCGIQSLDMGTLQDATDSRLGRRYKSLRLGIESGANTLQLGLGQPSGPLRHRGITFCLREDGGHGHGQDGWEGMLLASGLTGIGKAEEDLAQAFHLRVAQGDGLHRGFRPFGLRLRLGQPGTRLWLKGVNQEPFGLAVVDIAATRTAGEALGPAHIDPVGGTVTGTGKPRGFHESLGQHDGMAIDRLPVGRKPAQVERQDTRSQIGEGFSRENQKAGIIGDEVQTLAAQDLGPADPLLPCLTLVSGGLPAEKSYPSVIQSGHVTQGASRHRAEAAVMMCLHQGIPAFPLCGQDEAHLNAVQSGLLVRGECWGFHAVFLPHRPSGVHRWSLYYYINKLDWFLPEPWTVDRLTPMARAISLLER